MDQKTQLHRIAELFESWAIKMLTMHKKNVSLTHQAVHHDLVPDSSIATVLLHISPPNFVFEIVLIGTAKHRAVMACFCNFFRRRDGSELLPQTIDFSIKSLSFLVNAASLNRLQVVFGWWRRSEGILRAWCC